MRAGLYKCGETVKTEPLLEVKVESFAFVLAELNYRFKGHIMILVNLKLLKWKIISEQSSRQLSLYIHDLKLLESLAAGVKELVKRASFILFIK